MLPAHPCEGIGRPCPDPNLGGGAVVSTDVFVVAQSRHGLFLAERQVVPASTVTIVGQILQRGQGSFCILEAPFHIGIVGPMTADPAGAWRGVSTSIFRSTSIVRQPSDHHGKGFAHDVRTQMGDEAMEVGSVRSGHGFVLRVGLALQPEEAGNYHPSRLVGCANLHQIVDQRTVPSICSLPRGSPVCSERRATHGALKDDKFPLRPLLVER